MRTPNGTSEIFPHFVELRYAQQELSKFGILAITLELKSILFIYLINTSINDILFFIKEKLCFCLSGVGLVVWCWKFPLAPMGVLDPGSAHTRPSARPPIDTSGNYSAHMSGRGGLGGN